MKKYINSLLIIILSLFCCINIVNADDVIKKSNQATVTFNGHTSTGITLGSSGESLLHYNFDVHYNGLNFRGYCLDISYKASSKFNYTCTPDNSDTGRALAYIFEHPSGNEIVDALAMRFVAIRNGYNKSAMGKGLYIVRWLQIKTNYPGAEKFSSADLPHGNDALMEQAFALSETALASISSGSIKNSLDFKKVSTNGNRVTYTVTARQELKKEQIDFKCEGCEIKEKTWEGKTGKLVIEDTKDDCNYVINAYYPASQIITCDCGVECQQIVVAASSTNSDKIDTSGAPTQYYADSITEGDYFTNTCGGQNNKCSEEIPEVQANVNNCCEDSTTSTIVEPSLNDLFCRDNELNVDYYALKPGAQQYLYYDTDLNTDYCKMYCTERIETEIPGALTATNGKYFQLTQTSYGTYSPYVKSTKRCRIRVEYDKWINDYQEQVNTAIEQYNLYNENAAYHELYNDAEKTSHQIEDVNVYCSAKSQTTSYMENGVSISFSSPGSSDSYYSMANRSFKYDKYTFKKDNYYYRKTKIDNDLRRKYESEKILDEGKLYNANDPKKDYSYWSDSLLTTISQINEAVNSKRQGDCRTQAGHTICDVYECKASNGATAVVQLGEKAENVPQLIQNYKANAENAKNSYQAAVNKMKELQDDLTKCDKYFTPESTSSTSSAEHMYNVPTSLSNFKYTQVYQDEKGNPKQAQVTIGFAGNCNITGPFADANGVDTFASSGGSNNYSTNPYGRIFELMSVFDSSKTLSYNHEDKTLTSNKYHEKFTLSEPYKADKMFWHDGRYQAECSWERTDVDSYTVDNDGSVTSEKPGDGNNYRLVPRGEVYNYLQSTTNYTEHEFVFSFSTSYDGHFETYWNLRGLGENGKFDKYFEEGSGTCASENPADSELLTCRLHGFHGGSFYGCCCGDDGYTTNSTVSCDSYGDKAVLYDFKIIDPANVFPAATNGYATNWTDTETGKAAKKAIEELGKDLSTYSPDTLSYSFRLTPNDMKQIKEYNTRLNSYGGYTDNDLTCDCSQGQGDGNKDNNKSCVQCKSNFLNNIAEGKILEGKTLTGGWNRSDKTINEVRSSDKIKWAVNK